DSTLTMASASSSYKCTLDPEVLGKAKKELNEEPDTRLIEVKNLAKRLEKVPGLQPRLDVSFLLKFLRARKFDQQRTFELVKNYYQVRVDESEMFDDLRPSRVKHIIDAGVVEVLSGRDVNGCAVVVLRPGRWDPDRYPITDIPKTVYLVLMFLLEDETTQVHGVRFINNMIGLTMKHASHVGPSFAKKITGVIQNVVPMRFKKLDYVNEPTFFDVIFAIVKQFMKEKLLKRISMNGSKLENIHATVSPDILPKDLGGQVEPHSNNAWMERFLASDQMFIEDNKYGFVKMNLKKDKKKDGKTEDADIAGLGGTFKKLEV
ncbi:alpha-tocopherol transfer protein-like, partial [Plakobranchus ocellatus]